MIYIYYIYIIIYTYNGQKNERILQADHIGSCWNKSVNSVDLQTTSSSHGCFTMFKQFQKNTTFDLTNFDTFPPYFLQAELQGNQRRELLASKIC